MAKIAVIGAGSLVFTRKLVSDLLQQELTADAEITRPPWPPGASSTLLGCCCRPSSAWTTSAGLPTNCSMRMTSPGHRREAGPLRKAPASLPDQGAMARAASA
jgi:hypothetical protein